MNGETVVMPSPVALPLVPSTACESSASDVLSASSNSTLPMESTKMNGEQQSRNVQMESVRSPSVGENVPSLERLKQLLAAQLEYYFSRDNLANDTYLVSQMDGDQYVPIWTVANFNQIKKLTTDIKLITEVLKESPNVQVDDDEMRVRPSHKRCIVILREIDGSTPAEEVRAIFEKEETLPKMLSCDYAHNNVWYLTFESDEDAQKAYHYIRDHVKEYKGQPINARIKAKPQLNRYYGLPASGVPGGPIPPHASLAGLVSPAAVPLPVPLILAATPGAPLPVAVAPVVPNPLATAAAVAAIAAATTTATSESSLKNGFSPSSSGTPPPGESVPPSSGNSNLSVVTVAASQSQQQPHAQTHHQQQSQQHLHHQHPGQQPRFIYAGPPNGGSPYGAQPPLQLYAFHPHPSSFYTPTVLQAWPSTTATGTPFFDLGSVFAMNGLSPQATFKPSPNPRYPNVSGGRAGGRGGGTGSGFHRRNPSTASTTPSLGVVHQHSSPSFQGSGGNPGESLTSPYTATADTVSAANGSVGSTTAAPPSKTANNSSRPTVSGTSASAVSSTTFGAAQAPNTVTTVSPSAGRNSSNQEASGSVSTTSHQPIQKQAATDGYPAGGGGYGSHASSGEERRYEQHNERSFADRQSYGFGGRGGRGRPRGDRGNRGGYSYYRGGGNGSYRGGGGGGDRDRSDTRHSNSYGSGGGYQTRSMNGPSSHYYNHHQSMQQHQQPLTHQQQQSSYGSGGGGNHGHHSVSSSATSPAPDFDLQAESSFPPLPGLEAGSVGTTSSVTAASSATNSASSGLVSGNTETAHKVGDETGSSAGLDAENSGGAGGGSGGNPVANISGGGAWGESKLSDVVKGVVKPKSTSYHHNNNYGNKKPLLNGPVHPVVAPVISGTTSGTSKSATETPGSSFPTASLPNGDLAQSTLALTPPTSPGKGVKENKQGFSLGPNPPSTGAPTVTNNISTKSITKTPGAPPQTSSPPLPSSVEASKSGLATATAPPPPSVSYAKIAEQNKDRIEQIARESKERDLELERERRRVATQNKAATNQGNKAGNRPAASGQTPAATSIISSNPIPIGPLPVSSNQNQRRKENSISSDFVGGSSSRDRSKSP